MSLNTNQKDNLKVLKGIFRFLLGLSWLVISIIIVSLVVVLFREPSWQLARWIFIVLVVGIAAVYWIRVGLNGKSEQPLPMKGEATKFFKENWFKVSILIMSILTVGLSFWWFEIRPTIIKSQCAWTQRYIDAIPARPASHDWPDCLLKPKPLSKNGLTNLDNLFLGIFDCYEATPAQPADDYYSESSDDEYIFCLREHGL